MQLEIDTEVDMAKELKDLIKPKLTTYEMAEEIVSLQCYDGVLEAHELISQLTMEELTNMYNVGKIVEKYPKLWDRE